MGISGIIGKEIEKEFLGIQRAANGFPLHCRSRASPHLDPMPVLSQHGYLSETANCTEPLCFSERSELHQQKFNWKLMKLLDPSRFNCSLWADVPSRPSSAGQRWDTGSRGFQPLSRSWSPASPCTGCPLGAAGVPAEKAPEGDACGRTGGAGMAWVLESPPKPQHGAIPAACNAQAGRDRHAATLTFTIWAKLCSARGRALAFAQEQRF